MELKSNVPPGPIAEKWSRHKFEMKLVNPANKRKHSVIVVGSGLAGASAAATLAELGYQVACFCYQDSPRRAHSIAAQGGINAAKNYQNDGDSVYRLFYDTIKGGDFRSREANVYRLAEVSVNIIDQCVAQGVPFAREYGGMLANRSFGGAQVSRTFYARGQTGQQLLLGAYQALERQIGLGTVAMYPRHEMQELVVVDGQARGIVVRDLVTGKIESFAADAVILATGGYGNVFYLATYAKGCNATAIWRAYKKGAAFANPCYTQIHPTCIPVTGEHQSKLTLMSESLRNDGRIWVPKKQGRPPPAGPDPRGRARLLPRAEVSELRQPRPARHRLARRQGGLRRGPRRRQDRPGRLPRLRRRHRPARRRHDPRALRQPLRHVRADHRRGPVQGPDADLPGHPLHDGRALGRLQPDEHDPRPVRLRRGQFLRPRRQPARRQRADAGAGRRLLHHPLHASATTSPRPSSAKVGTDHPAFKEAEAAVDARLKTLLGIKGKRTVDTFHRELGKIMWDHCGMARNEQACKLALEKIPALREEFWNDVCVLGDGGEVNQSLEKAGRVADFLELGELLCLDALERRESCGGHFREEYQTADGEAARDDEHFCHVAAWEYTGDGQPPDPARRAARPSRTSRSRHGVTNNDEHDHEHGRPPDRGSASSEGHGAEQTINLTLNVWRQKDRHADGPVRHLRGPRHQHRHVVPRDARRRQRGADPQRRGADRLRPRLPRGDLRPVRGRHQRRRRTARAARRRPASSTCGASTTATS